MKGRPAKDPRKGSRWRSAAAPSPTTDHFENEALEAAVRVSLELQDGDPLTEAVLANLGSIAATDAGVTSLEGLQCARNLVYLTMHNNAIPDAESTVGLAELSA